MSALLRRSLRTYYSRYAFSLNASRVFPQSPARFTVTVHCPMEPRSSSGAVNEHKTTSTKHVPTESFSPKVQDQQNLARLMHIRFMVRRLLKHKSPEEAYGYFTRRVEATKSDRAFLFAAYERVILIFLRDGCFDHARKLYGDMHAAGLYPSSRTRAIMHAIDLIQSPDYDHTSSQVLLDKLKPTLKLPSFTDDALQALLDILESALHVDPKTRIALIKYHESLQGDDYEPSPGVVDRLVRCYGASGSLTTALENAAERSEATLYTSLLNTLSQAGRSSPATADAVLSHMATAGVTPDLGVFNALISAAVRSQEIGTAFSLYNALLEHPTLVPDAFTYGSLFKATEAVIKQRSARTRRTKVPQNVRSARQLFSEMFMFHAMHTRTFIRHWSPIVRPSTLGVALRSFMLACDYTAALVVLRAYNILDIKPDVRVFRTVIVTLLRHVQLDLRSHQDDVRWVDRFLGELAGRLGPEDISSVMVDELLRLGDIEHSSVAQSADVQDNNADGETKRTKDAAKHRKRHVPTKEMILGIEPETVAVRWDVGPLERILSRAILATLEDTDYSDKKVLGLVVGDAEREMMPSLTRETMARALAERDGMAGRGEKTTKDST